MKRTPRISVWLVQIGEPLPLDPSNSVMRTGALAKALAARGHRILWWTSAFDHFQKRWLFTRDEQFTLPGLATGFALRGLGYSHNTSPWRFLDHRMVSWKWMHYARTMDLPDVIVASMPPHDLAAQVVSFANRFHIPVILDIRDPWPHALLHIPPVWLQPLARMILSRDISLHARAAKNASSVVAVSEALLTLQYQVSDRRASQADKVIYTGYHPSRAGSTSPHLDALLSKLHGKFVIAFVGTFAFYHAPWVVLEAMAHLPSDICFVLAGDGAERIRMEQAAEGIPNLFFPGWLSPEETVQLLARAHVGICPARKPIDVFPNKAFAYMAAGMPIVASFDGDLRRLIETHTVGMYTPPNDVATFVSCIKRLHNDDAFRLMAGDNAKRTFEERFDARKTMADFADHVEHMAKQRASAMYKHS